jgi:hypothetical protein
MKKGFNIKTIRTVEVDTVEKILTDHMKSGYIHNRERWMHMCHIANLFAEAFFTEEKDKEDFVVRITGNNI